MTVTDTAFPTFEVSSSSCPRTGINLKFCRPGPAAGELAGAAVTPEIHFRVPSPGPSVLSLPVSLSSEAHCQACHWHASVTVPVVLRLASLSEVASISQSMDFRVDHDIRRSPSREVKIQTIS